MLQFLPLACRVLPAVVLLLVGYSVFAQDRVDYTAVSQPAVASRLGLSDQQRSQVAKILQQRIEQLIAAKPDDRAKVIAQSNTALEGLLTSSQRQSFAGAMGDEQMLSFNFRMQTWPDVLSWFARQAGLSLVMDSAPEGSFTYSDTKDYTPAEAIDLLNSVLITKGYSLVRRERMLIVTRTDGGIPFDVVPQISVDELSKRGRFEYVSVMLPLGNRNVENTLKEVEPFRSVNGTVRPLPETKQLQVVDTAGRVEAIRKVIQSIPEKKEKSPEKKKPKPAPPKPVFQVHSIKGLNPGAAIDALNKLFDEAKLTADQKAEQISAFAVPSRQEGIRKAIEQMLANASGDREPRLEVYPIEGRDLDEIRQVLVQAHSGIQVSRDEEANRLLVVADSQQHEAVQQTLRKLNAISDSESRVVVYPVEPEMTERVAALLRPLLPRANVVSETGRIAVRGRSAEQQVAKEMISQLVTAEAELEQPALRFHSLPNRIDKDLLETLQQMFPKADISTINDDHQLAVIARQDDHDRLGVAIQRIATEAAPEPKTLKFYPGSQPLKDRFERLKANYQLQLDGVKIVMDSSPDEFAVQATAEGHEAFAGILAELQRERDNEQVTMHRFDVTVSDPNQLRTMLGQKYPAVRMLLSEDKKSLLVWTSDTRLEEIRREYETLSAVMPKAQEPTMIAYSTMSMAFAELRGLLQPIARSAQFTPDQQGGRMFVWATDTDHQRIKETLASIQSERGGEATQFRKIVMAHPLTSTTPSSIVRMLRELKNDASFAADDRGNRILITAPLAEQKRLKAIIEQLDLPPGKNVEKSVRTYAINTTAASSVSRLLQPLVPNMQLSPNNRARELIASGTGFDHEKLSAAIQQLNGGGARGTVRSYNVGTSDPDEVRNVLRQLVPNAIVSANEATRSVVVWGDEAEQTTIKTAIDQFTKQWDTSDRQLRSYPLPQGMGDTVLYVVRAVAPAAMMDTDQSEGELVCWGTEQEHAAISAAMKTLAESKQHTLRVYPLGKLRRKTAARAIEEAFAHVELIDTPDASQLVILSPPDQHAQIQETLTELQRTVADGDATVHVYAIDRKRANAEVVRDALGELLNDLSVEINEQTNSLIIRTTAARHEEIQLAIDAILTQLPRTEERTTEVYHLQHGDVGSARSVLRRLLTDVTFAEDRDTGTLAATAYADQHEKIRVVVQQMDAPQQNRRTTEIYRFDRVSAYSAERAFQNLAPQARVSTIRGTNSVVATASAADHEQFRETANKLNGPGGETVVKVYPLDKNQLDVEDLVASIDETLRSRVAIRTNEAMNSLIVRGSPEDQAIIQTTVDEIVRQIPPLKKRTTAFFRFDHGDGRAARTTLREMFDDAIIAYDYQNRTLAVTASEEDQVRIKALVQQMDQPAETIRSTVIYRFQRADARIARNVLRRMFEDATFEFDDESNTLVATAREQQHQTIKSVVKQMDAPATNGRTTVVYRFQRGNPRSARQVLEAMFENARFADDNRSQTLAATATQEQHKTIKSVVDQMDLPTTSDRETVVYRFQRGNPRSARNVLQDMFEDATFASDYGSNTLAATATAEQHQSIKTVVEQMDQPAINDKLTRMYRVKNADASRVSSALDEMLEDGSVTFDPNSNTLLVTANEAEHARIQTSVDALNQPAADTLTTKVYALTLADPNAVRNALSPLVPQAKLTSDPASGAVIVTGTPEEHARINEVVTELDTVPGQQTEVRAYPIQFADAKLVHQSLANTFQGNGNFSISFQESSRTMFLAATPKNHAVFEELVAQLDKPALAEASRMAKAYPLANVSGPAARTAVSGMLQNQLPAAQVELDPLGNSLIVVATRSQHQSIAETIAQLAGKATELEVFELQFVDPWFVESAITSLYENVPAGSAPTISSDYSSQRLFVRGSETQINEVRGLLSKMGELASTQSTGGGSGEIRTIPFRGDTAAAVRQIEQLWPRLRKNRIQVIVPSDPGLKIDKPNDKGAPDESNDETSDASDAIGGGIDSSVRTNSHAPQSTEAKPRFTTLANNTLFSSKFVALQTGDDEANDTNTTQPGEDATVVIVPDEDRITIASSDQEALNQLESLLRALSRADSDHNSSNSDFAVFLLRNTGASEIRQLLGELFEQVRDNSSGSVGSFGMVGPSFGPNFGEVAVVADDRLNALIVHGERQERQLIKELLEILDSEDLPNPIVVYSPELLALHNAQANRVLGILRNVYKSQLTSGGGRKSVEIPEGVSSEVASVLQQINAAAAAPILTLDIDQATNSIIMRAPPELRREIKSFVGELDGMADSNRQKNVRVIQLKRGKADNIQAVLEQFILDPERN